MSSNIHGSRIKILECGLIGRDQVSGLQEEGVAFRGFTLVLQQRIFEYKRSRKRISTFENYSNLEFRTFQLPYRKNTLVMLAPLLNTFSQRIALDTELEFHRLLCCRPEQFTSEDNSIVVKHLNIDSIPKHWPEDIYKVVDI